MHDYIGKLMFMYNYGCDISLFREQYIQGKIPYLGTYIVSSSDVLIIRSVSLSTISCHYNIINCFFDCHNYWENGHFLWKNQIPEGRYNIGLVLVIGIYIYIYIYNYILYI